MMSRADRARLRGWQGAALDRMIRSGSSQAAVADICGVSEGLVSHWRAGTKTMMPWHLERVVVAYGEEVVFGVAPKLGRPDLRRVFAELGHQVSGAQLQAIEGMDDGAYDAEEVAALEASLDAMLANVAEGRAALRRARSRLGAV